MRFHIVMNRFTGEVVKVEEVGDDFSLEDAVHDCDECNARPPPLVAPVGFVSPEELDAAVAHALQSSPRWRRRQRGARGPS